MAKSICSNLKFTFIVEKVYIIYLYNYRTKANFFFPCYCFKLLCTKQNSFFCYLNLKYILSFLLEKK